MDEHGYTQCMPSAPGRRYERQPLIDFRSGYVLRSIDALPRQGARAPWRLYQNYARDIRLLRRGTLEDGAMQFSSPVRTAMPAMARSDSYVSSTSTSNSISSARFTGRELTPTASRAWRPRSPNTSTNTSDAPSITCV